MKTLAEIEEYWRGEFRDHRATLAEHGPLVLIGWRKPGTRINSADFIIVPKSGYLHVQGDLGSAAFWWGSNHNLSLAFLAGCNFDYFVGKCESHEYGRQPTGWDSDKGVASLREQWGHLESEGADIAAPLHEILDAMHSIHGDSRGAWEMWVNSNLYDAGSDPEDCTTIMRAGEVPDSQCVAYWLGLKMAHEQLKAKEKAA